jgi:hypothetical protein
MLGYAIRARTVSCFVSPCMLHALAISSQSSCFHFNVKHLTPRLYHISMQHSSHHKSKLTQDTSAQDASLPVTNPAFAHGGLLLGQHFQTCESDVDSVESEKEGPLDLIRSGDGVRMCGGA